MIVDFVTPLLSPLLMSVSAVTPITQVEPPAIALGGAVGDKFSTAAFMDNEYDVNSTINSEVLEPNIILEALGNTEEDLPSEPTTMAQLKSQHSKLKSLICEHQKRLHSPKVILLDKLAANSVLELECLWAFNNTQFKLQTKLQKQKNAISNAPPRM